MRFVNELGHLVVEARKVANNYSILDALSIKCIIEEPVSNKNGALANKEYLVDFHELILNYATAVLLVLSWL